MAFPKFFVDFNVTGSAIIGGGIVTIGYFKWSMGVMTGEACVIVH